ncbi:unnamed protein product [Sympodiomycopsis kandeliae]
MEESPAAQTHREPLSPANESDKIHDVKEEKKVSCSTCREAKVKCITDESESRCRRCIKYDSECKFEGHRRGRRKGKIKQHQVNRRFELIARTLEELRSLTRALQDAPAIALVASLRYQLLSSTCINPETRAILDHSHALGEDDLQINVKGQKRQRETNADKDSSSDEDDELKIGLGYADPGSGAIRTADSAYSIMGQAAESQNLSVTPRPAPGSYSRESGLDQHNGSQAPRSAASYPGRSRMLHRPKRSNAEADTRAASKSASLLVEIEDYESVAVVPQAVQTLSNPLKLLAHASDTVDSASRKSTSRSPAGSRREPVPSVGRESTAASSAFQRHVEPHARAPMEEDELVPEHRRLNKSMDQREAAAWSHFTDGRSNDRQKGRTNQEHEESQGAHIEWSTYFSRGAFHPRYDSGASIDPIEKGLMTMEQAQTLLDFFYNNFSTFVHCFDPNLSTLSYLRKHSAFLVSVLCFVAAEYHPTSAFRPISRRLGEYVEECLPAVMSGAYKSVEIAQACYILASYQRMSDSAVDDQTWALLGTSIRIASELGCNLACFSYSAPAGDPAIEKHHRQLKNTERLWLTLWIHEKTLASQTGQKLHLAEDPIISSCGTWHQRPYAMPQDEALVAFVDLRRIMDRHAATFHTQILRALTSRNPEGGPHSKRRETGHSEQLMFLVDLYRANVHVDFKRWEESWLTGSADVVNPKLPLQCTGILHLHFASLVILSLPLRSTSERPTQDFDSLRRDCYGAALGFLSAFVDRSERGLLPCITNAIAVSAVYCAIFALKLCVLSSDVAPFINRVRVANLARNLARELRKAGSSPSHRAKMSVPARFADYLYGYLSRWEAQQSPTTSLGSSPTSRRASGGAPSLPTFSKLPAAMQSSSAGPDAFQSGQANHAPFSASSPPFQNPSFQGLPPEIQRQQATSRHPPRMASGSTQHYATFPFSSEGATSSQLSQAVNHPADVPQSINALNSEQGGNLGTQTQALHSPPLPPPVMGEETEVTKLDEFWKNMTGGSWDNFTGFAPLLDQMGGFDFFEPPHGVASHPPNAPPNQ